MAQMKRWAAKAEPRFPKLRQASRYTKFSHWTAKQGTLAGSRKNHLYHLDMSDFQMNTRCPGYKFLVRMMALTMDKEFGKVSFHGAPLWNLGLMKELIPPCTCEQSVTVRRQTEDFLNTDPNGLRKNLNGSSEDLNGPTREPKETSFLT